MGGLNTGGRTKTLQGDQKQCLGVYLVKESISYGCHFDVIVFCDYLIPRDNIKDSSKTLDTKESVESDRIEKISLAESERFDENNFKSTDVEDNNISSNTEIFGQTYSSTANRETLITITENKLVDELIKE